MDLEGLKISDPNEVILAHAGLEQIGEKKIIFKFDNYYVDQKGKVKIELDKDSNDKKSYIEFTLNTRINQRKKGIMEVVFYYVKSNDQGFEWERYKDLRHAVEAHIFEPDGKKIWKTFNSELSGYMSDMDNFVFAIDSNSELPFVSNSLIIEANIKTFRYKPLTLMKMVKKDNSD